MGMMMNLFSVFDPSTSYASASWMVMSIPIIAMAIKTAMVTSKKKMTMKISMMAMKKGMKELMKKSETKSSVGAMITVFILISTMNIVAILPFNYTPTAHISITLGISMTVWTALLTNSLANSFKDTMTHLTPLGTPNSLMNFMVVIETVSQLIRPITLAVRLMANMVAGHLLMSLLSNFSMANKSTSMASAIPMAILIMLESGVAIIQAYVITTLSTLYYKETF